MESLLRREPSIEEVREVLDELLGKEPPQRAEEVILTTPRWAIGVLMSARDSTLGDIKQTIMGRIMEGRDGIASITVGDVGGPIMQSLQLAFILGAQAERRGWDTDIHILEVEDVL